MPPIMQSVRFGMGNTLALGILLGGTVASARECPAPKGSSPELASVLAEDRIRFLARTLTDTARRERDYAIGWSLTYAGLSAASWVMLPLSSSDDPGQLVETAWNSGTSAFAALYVLYAPLSAVRAVHKLNQRLASANDDVCAQLAEAERVFFKVADNQKGGRDALAHIGNVAFNVGLGLVLGYALHRPNGAAISTSIGVVMGELMIATRPSGALSTLADYQKGRLLAPPTSPSLALPFQLVPTLQNQTYGLTLIRSF